MSYTINRYNGTQIAVVADGTINTSLDITLIGKNYAGFGELQNENFVFLLENFANTSPPPNPMSGQLWFDSGNNKLKFFDGTQFRAPGGAESGSVAPSGLTIGDFWFNTTTNQLYAWSGTAYTLIGPQSAIGQGVTQMQSANVQDTNGNTHAIIQAVVNGQTIFVTSSDPAFTLDNAANPITGFTDIQQGVTLAFTDNSATPGQTTSAHRFFGTATDSDRLGGVPASAFVQGTNATFTTLTNFADTGFTVGNPIAKLAVYNDGATTPTINNEYGDTIVFKTTVSAVSKTPLMLVGNDILPGVTNVSNIGSANNKWNNVYATYVYSTAAQADTLNVAGVYVGSSTSAAINTVAARTATGTLNVADAIIASNAVTLNQLQNNTLAFAPASIIASGNIQTGGSITAAGNITAYSDETLKDNWSDINSSILEEITNIKYGTYDRVDHPEFGRQIGVGAQSLQKILPEAVELSENGLLSVNYGNAALVLVVELTKLVKQLQQEINSLKNK